MFNLKTHRIKTHCVKIHRIKSVICKIILYAKVARIQTVVFALLQCILASVYCTQYYCKQHCCTKHCCSQHYSQYFLITLSCVLFNFAVNTISEYRDFKKGIDNSESPGTQFRLVTGILPPKNIKILGICSFISAVICGLIALYYSSIILLIPGVLGAALVWFYSEKPFELKYKAFGEIMVFIAYGPLIGLAFSISCYNYDLTLNVLTQCVSTLSISILSISILSVLMPGALLITNVLLANNIRDYEFDLNHTNTIVTKYGRDVAYKLLCVLAYTAFALWLLLVVLNVLPKIVLLNFSFLPLVIFSKKFKDHPKFINFCGILFVITELICIFSI